MFRSAAILLLLVVAPLAQASQVQSVLPGAELRGAATFRFLGLPLYQARLFTDRGAPFDWQSDFALELTYLRNLTEYDLVEGTMRELGRNGPPLPVRPQLEGCFNDVRKGDRYLAVTRGQNQIGFWLNGRQTCSLTHPQIKSRFMAIFLGDNTRSRAFTRKLKGN